MPISVAIQRGSVVYVYDEKNRQIFNVPGGTGPKDGLTGFTGSTVSVKRGSVIYVYDEKGRQQATLRAQSVLLAPHTVVILAGRAFTR